MRNLHLSVLVPCILVLVLGLNNAYVQMTCRSRTRLINLQYGTRPGDWIFWLSEPTDEFAGDFWSMIEDWILWLSEPSDEFTGEFRSMIEDPLENEAEECPMVFQMPGSWNEAEDSSSDEE